MKPDLWLSQNLFFEWTGANLPDIRARAREGDREARQGLELAICLGGVLSVEVSE